MTLAIETRHLTKRFRSLRTWRDVLLAPWRPLGRTAVDDVSLTVPAGGVFGLLGQNGAGKTTLIRMLTTLLVPTGGDARIAGHDVVRDAQEVRRRIGLISGDERSFYWRLTGRQNLEFFAALQHLPAAVAKPRIGELSDRLGIGESLDRPFGQLSTGQRQKLAIVRGMLAEPEILFMDEPTRSLDPISAVTIRDFVAEHIVGELGRTVVLATHSMPEAEALCSRLAFIQDGRIVAEGSVDELRRTIGYGLRCRLRVRGATARTLVDVQAFPGVVSASVVVVDAADPATHLTIDAVLGGDEVLGPLLRRVMELGVEIAGCETRELSLEEIYVRTLAPTPRVASAPTGEHRPVTAP